MTIMRVLAVSVLLLANGASAFAASEADYKTAYAAAEAANKDAGALRNQWTTTASTLSAAKKAGDHERCPHLAAPVAAHGRAPGPEMGRPLLR